MNNSLLIQREQQGAKTVVSVKGRINTDNYHQLNDELQALDYTDLDLVLDFSGVDYITSAGLRTLLIARKKLTADRMTIKNVSEPVREVFDMSGFSEFFTIEASAAAFPEDPSFKQLLAYRVKTAPDKPAYICEDAVYTWADVDRCSQIIADDLAKLGVKKGSHVGILSKNSVNWFLTFFAVQKLGAIVVLLNFSLKPEEIRVYAEIGDVTHLCYGDISPKVDRNALAGEVTKGDSLIRKTYDIGSQLDFRTRYDELPALEGRYADAFEPDDPSVMIFTSGTTSRPKGVLASAHDLMSDVKILSNAIRTHENDRICLFLPLCHIFGFGTGLGFSLSEDLPIYIPRSIADADLIETIAKYGCTLFNSVPTKIISMAQSESFSPEKVSTLRSSMIGGAAISAAQLSDLREKMPGVHFMPIYGMSEISPISLVPYEDTPEHIVSTVGKPVDGVTVEIRDPATKKVKAAGEEGEITVKSAHSMLCYYKLDIDKQAIDGEGWIPTGDLGVLDPDGYLRITGRIKDLIIRGGENIAPKEIENAITEFNGVSDVKVVGIPDELFGEIVGAAIVMKAGESFDRKALEASIRPKLASFKLPAHYVTYEAFPLLANGKVNMLDLKRDVVAKIKAGQSL